MEEDQNPILEEEEIALSDEEIDEIEVEELDIYADNEGTEGATL